MWNHSSGSLDKAGLQSDCNPEFQKRTKRKETSVSWWKRGSYFVDRIHEHLTCHFIPKNWFFYAGPFILLCFMAKKAFTRIWIIYFSFSKTSVFPCMMLLFMYCRCLGASPWSSAVRISSWKIEKLYFHPWGSQFHVYWNAPPSKSKLWPTLCCQND